MSANLPLLVEIGSEEIPAAVVPVAAQWLVEQLAQVLGVAANTGTWLATPRRLIAHFDAVAERQADREQTATGPALAVAKSADGQWSKAAEGFARGQGVTTADLTVLDTAKGQYIAAVKRIAGRTTADLVAEALPRLLRTLPVPKRMRWGRQAEPFIRPLHWLVALHGGRQIDFEFAGVKSGRLVGGHRFYHPQPLEAGVDLEDHKARLRAAHVIADPAERQLIIERGLRQLAAEVGATWRQDPQTLHTVVYLVEWPAPLRGEFAQHFLEIAPEVIFTTLRENQKLFTLNDAAGKLSHHFIAVANTLSESSRAVVAAGNARVVSARLADAQFFYREDIRRPLALRRQDLDTRIYLAGLGTIGDRVGRIEAIAAAIAMQVCPALAAQVQRAAQLCKADLTTKMVFEFPELQGTIGAYYAREDGESAQVASAIAEHYQPRFAGDAIAVSVVGQVVAIADKIDAIVGCFALGLHPTGTQDPYSLRRAALGVLRTLAEAKLPISLALVIDVALAQLPQSLRAKAGAPLRDQVITFVRGRLAAHFSGEFGVDATEAVLDAGFDRVDSVQPRLLAVHQLRQHADFAALAAAFKRVGNLVKKSATAGDLGAQFSEQLCEKDAERALFAQVQALSATTAAALAASDYPTALQALAHLRPQVDSFFDGVMVMTDDAGLRRNRLALLGLVAGLFSPIADFGRLQG
ncbi:MAG: glycine--tRNA ligase subunit beta [Myxococcales bacterium]|nr:glycine--tRNA ligase subunit beta [Myxococcales bacterium]